MLLNIFWTCQTSGVKLASKGVMMSGKYEITVSKEVQNAWISFDFTYVINYMTLVTWEEHVTCWSFKTIAKVLHGRAYHLVACVWADMSQKMLLSGFDHMVRKNIWMPHGSAWKHVLRPFSWSSHGWRKNCCGGLQIDKEAFLTIL